MGLPPQLLQYLERFQGALEGLARAAELAPGWDEPRKRHGNLLEFLTRLCGLLESRVGMGGTGRGWEGIWGHWDGLG